MQRIVFPVFRLSIVLALCAAAVHGAPQSDSGPLPDRQVNAKADPCVRLRSGADLDRVVLDCLEPGTRLRLLGAISGWSHVRLLDGTEGWLDSRFLEMAPGLPMTRLAAAPSATSAEPPVDPGTDVRGQIAVLEGQLRAAASRNEATEERLRRTVAAAETAQREAIALRERVEQLERAAAEAGDANQVDARLAASAARVTELEAALAAAEQGSQRAAGLNAEQERRLEALDSSLTAARARQAELQQSLAVAERTTSEQVQRIRQLEADLPAARDRETELRQTVATIQGRLRAAEQSGSAQATRAAQLEAQVQSALAREAEARQALAAAQDQLRSAQQESSKQAGGIAELAAVPPPDSPRKKELKARLRAAERASTEQAERIARLEADLAASEAREAESRQATAAAEERLRAAERFGAEQAGRIDSLTAQLADREVQLAEATLKRRLAARDEPAAPPPAESPVPVRAPIVSAPEPPKVTVRVPAALTERSAAPTEEPAEPETPTTEAPATEAAINAVRAWAAAWSDQRVEDYLSFYASSFRPADGLGRDAWEAQRRQRLSRPRYIKVTLASLAGEPADDGTVRATFRQDYESDTFADSVTKVLSLAAENGTWRIVEERATP